MRDWTSLDDEHYILVARAMLEGEVIPFLGAGANLLAVPSELTGHGGRGDRGRHLRAQRAARPGVVLRDRVRVAVGDIYRRAVGTDDDPERPWPALTVAGGFGVSAPNTPMSYCETDDPRPLVT
jgi:hypothetical protein